MEKLKKAFENRIGKQDHESFIEVVMAFFEELKDDGLLTVPMMIVGELGYQPLLLPMKEGEFALIVVSDPEYMIYFKDKTCAHYGAKAVVSIMEEHDEISGILINPFSESHCFLPKRDTEAVMEMNGIQIL